MKYSAIKLSLFVSVMPIFIGCDESNLGTQQLVSVEAEVAEIEEDPDLELRILDVVLIDPRTGNPPPKDALLHLAAPTGVMYPLVLEYPERHRDDDPFAFRMTWYDEKSKERFVKVHLRGYKVLHVGLKYTKREQAHVMLSKRIQRIIHLEPIEGEQGEEEASH